MITRLIIFIWIGVGLFCCRPDHNLIHEIEPLIQNKIESNEEILEKIATFINEHGKDGFKSQQDIVLNFQKQHDKVIAFLDSLDGIENKDRAQAAKNFVRKTFNYRIEYPYKLSISENTPTALIKLQIVDMENVHLRYWEDEVSVKFNNIAATIIPDKIFFSKGEKVTGRVGWMAYADELKLNVRVNGKPIEVKDGLGYFSIDPTEISAAQRSLKAEIIFPDTVYTTEMLYDVRK